MKNRLSVKIPPILKPCEGLVVNLRHPRKPSHHRCCCFNSQKWGVTTEQQNLKVEVNAGGAVAEVIYMVHWTSLPVFDFCFLYHSPKTCLYDGRTILSSMEFSSCLRFVCPTGLCSWVPEISTFAKQSNRHQVCSCYIWVVIVPNIPSST